MPSSDWTVGKSVGSFYWLMIGMGARSTLDRTTLVRWTWVLWGSKLNVSWGARCGEHPSHGLCISFCLWDPVLLLSIMAVFRIYNPNKSFPPQVTVSYGINHGNIKQARTMCMSVLPAYMHVWHIHVWCLQSLEEDIRSPGSWLWTMWVLGMEPGFSATSASVFNCKLSLQTQGVLFCLCLVRVLLYGLGCLRACYIDSAIFKLRNLPDSASWMLGLDVCATMLGHAQLFFFFNLY